MSLCWGVNQSPLKREEFSKPVSSAALQLKEEEEPDFSLIWLPPSPHVSSLPFPISLQSFTRQRSSAVVKSRMNFHSSSYLRQTISICTALFSLMANRRAASCSSSSISILLWRVHPLALHLIALSAWPRNQGRVSEGSTSSTASHLSSSPQGAAALSHWLLGNVPTLLCPIDQV